MKQWNRTDLALLGHRREAHDGEEPVKAYPQGHKLPSAVARIVTVRHLREVLAGSEETTRAERLALTIVLDLLEGGSL